MNKEKYLARFHARAKKEITFEQLDELQFMHMQHIPFENLDVIRRIPIYLNLESIYEKVVGRQRGGYCYELNGLFHWLLSELGYDAKLIAATVRRPNGTWAKSDTHAAIIVELDQSYLVDVGFGDSTLHPISLNGRPHKDHSGLYRVESREDDCYDLIRQTRDDEKTLYRFSTVAKQLVDFHEGCVFNQVSKNSSFTHADLVTRATQDGRITLSGTQLTRSDNGEKQKSDLTFEEKQLVLKTDFGINPESLY
ncbi:arylamine N-acetyltransferase family protein [Planococcus versutus]|uniref:Arylamine N-acetyltransferase n=1 Tax=Planococcus versutus TaxID=1302659 RepID=A0A1B1S5S2_9BACL|nr:arylamine N-acetyltransferase [Planococcus versutus]ANU28533.1 hypothetical protein I858_016220 [Planococcus versutus]